jgi:hypothetical protein
MDLQGSMGVKAFESSGGALETAESTPKQRHSP